MIALGLLRSTYFLTDIWFVGRLGDDALAAIGGSAFAWWMIHTLCDLSGVGVHALVARWEGGRQRERIPSTLAQGLWVSLVVAVVLAALARPGTLAYFDLLGFADGAGPTRLGVQYLSVSLITAGTLAVYAVILAAFRALGQTRTALVITAVTLVVNLALDPALIWGWGPLPALGIGGAAWATAVANGVGAVAGAAVLARRGIRLRYEAPTSEARRVAAIGGPITVAGLGFSLVYVLLGRIINGFGDEHMAALGVGHRLESIAYMATVGFSVGAATMVGQHLGAGSVERAREAAAAANRLCAAWMVPVTATMLVGAPVFLGWFTDDPAIVASGTTYLRLQSLVFVAMGVEVVLEGAFSGAGDTLPPLVIGGTLTAARLPMAWAFGEWAGLGITGVWIAIAVSTLGKAVVLGGWWRRGRWAKVLE